jgi:EmrB/QacA subfamily drug resistance transporter
MSEATIPADLGAADPATGRVSRRGNPWWTLISVAVGVMMVGLDGTVVSIANPKIADDLHASLADLQWITNAYLLALAALLIVGGKLGDRYGRRNVFLVGVVGFALMSVAIGLVDSTTGVIVFRALQGVFGALLMPNTLAILRGAFPAEKLNMAIGIWGAASALSVAAGPIIGGLLVEHVNWQSVFFINAPLGAIALVIGVLVLSETKDESGNHRLDWPGIISLSGSLFLLVFGLIKAQEWGWLSGKTLGFIAAGLLVMAAFVLIELRSRQPLLPMRLFRNRSLSVGTAVVMINFFAMFGVLFFITLYLQNVQGLSPLESGARTLPLSLALMVSAPLGGALTQRFGPRLPMVTGLLVVAVALGSLIFLEPDSSYNALWPAFLLVGAGIGLVMTSSSDAIVGNASVNDAGIAGGLQSTALQFGGVIGTAILGSVLTSRIGSVLVEKLIAAGTPTDLAHQLNSAQELVGQGQAPVVTGVPASTQAAIVEGSHNAFMTGLHTSMIVAMIAALLGAAVALLVRRGENSGAGMPAGH